MMSFGRLGASFGRLGSRGGASGPRIQLSSSTIADTASIGDTVGALSVSGGTGSYTFTLTSNPGSLFSITGSALKVAAALTAGSDAITVQADNGVDAPVSRSFLITVTPKPISAPTIDLASTSDTGVSSVDNITNDTTPDFDITPAVGFALIEGDIVTMFIDGIAQPSHTVTSAEELAGAVSMGLAALPEGTHVVGVTHTRDGSTSAQASLSVTIDTTAPVLTSAMGDITGDLSIYTNDASGELYWVATTSSTPPTTAQIKLGQNDAGVVADASGSQVVVATGAQSVSASGLHPSTEYFAHFLHMDVAGNNSGVISSPGFTTEAGTGPSYTAREMIVGADGFSIFLNSSEPRQTVIQGLFVNQG